MRKEAQNNYLVIVALIAIVLSVVSVLSLLGNLGITGAATEVGYVNVTVPTTAEITIHTTSINFTGTNPGDTKTSYESDDVATREGVPCDVDNHCGMNISNDGSGFINVTIQETESLFTSGGYSADSHFLYNVTMQDAAYVEGNVYSGKANCSVGYAGGFAGVGGVGYWRGVPSSSAEVAICYLNYTDAVPGGGDSDSRPDIARVEFNITVPDGEGSGDKAGTITFIASTAET